MIIWVLSGLVVLIVVTAVVVWRLLHKRKHNGSVPAPIMKEPHNDNVQINGKEFLSEEASRLLDAIGDREDPRFIGSKNW